MKPEEMVPRPKVAREFGVHVRTIKRWEDQRKPGFDQAIIINDRGYHQRSNIEAVKLGSLKSGGE
jgi:hypothetical protein